VTVWTDAISPGGLYVCAAGGRAQVQTSFTTAITIEAIRQATQMIIK
jgi:hypothetical protein